MALGLPLVLFKLTVVTAATLFGGSLPLPKSKVLRLGQFRTSPFGRVTTRITGFTALEVLLPLAQCASARDRVLDWSPARRGTRRKPSCVKRISLYYRFWLWLFIVFGLPCRVWAAPKGLHLAVEVAAGFSGVAPPGLRVDLMPEELETSSAVDPHSVSIATIGLHILAPHYHTAYTSVQLGAEEGFDEVLAAAITTAAQSFHPDLSVVEPCRLQLFVGYASFVAQPACRST